MHSLDKYIESLQRDAAFWQKKVEQDKDSSDPVYRQVADENLDKVKLLTSVIQNLVSIRQALQQERMELLQKFWGRASDACPLECSEHEAQLKQWQQWIDSSSTFPPTPIPEGNNPYRLA